MRGGIEHQRILIEKIVFRTVLVVLSLIFVLGISYEIYKAWCNC